MINLRSAAGNASIAAGCLIVLGIAAILLSRSQPPEATPVEKALAATARPAGKTFGILDWYHDLLEMSMVCDRSFTDMSGAFWALGSGGDKQVAYGKARDAEATCRQAWQAIQRVRPPANAADAPEGSASAAIERCGKMVLVRMRGAKTAMELIDGNFGSIQIFSARKALAADKAATAACTAFVTEFGRNQEAGQHIDARVVGTGRCNKSAAC